MNLCIIKFTNFYELSSGIFYLLDFKNIIFYIFGSSGLFISLER